MEPLIISEFVTKQLELINLEKNAEIEEQKTYLETLSLSTLQSKGLCLSKLKVASYKTGLYGRCVVKFEPKWAMGNAGVIILPANKFSSGDIAGIWAGGKDGGSREVLASGVVTACSSTSIHIAFEQAFELLNLSSDSGTYSLVKLSNDVTYRRMKKALESLSRYEEKGGPASHMIDVLFGIANPTEINYNFDEKFKPTNSALNQPQKDAIKLALNQKEVSIIHGPPGTGKTTTVVEIILQLARQGCKMLVCAPSNMAVDNLLERLSRWKGLKLIRLGHPARVMQTTQKYSLDYILSTCDGSQVILELRQEIDQLSMKNKRTNQGSKSDRTTKSYVSRDERKRLSKELKERERNVLSDVLKNADVILSTLIGASDEGPLKHLPTDHFDLVIIDECSQALEAACWIPLLKGRRCLLAGDHMQLPPTIFSKEAAQNGLEVSLMERLVKMDEIRQRNNVSHTPSVVKLLEIQYRMHFDIMKISSSTLYDDKLVADESVASHLLNDLPNIQDNEFTSVPLFLIDTAGCHMNELEVDEEDSKGNEGEADLVSIHVDNLINSGIDPEDIAIIAPYNLQVELIRIRLLHKYPRLEIKSVDGFQGREKEVVVLSLVRSNDRGEVGFLSEDRRINVAITRAKRHLAVICDSITVSRHPFLKNLVDYLNVHGEVRSANEFRNALDSLENEVSRPDRLKNQNKKPTSKNKPNKGALVKTVDDSRPNSGNCLKKSSKKLSSEEQVKFDEQRRSEYEKTIAEFVMDKAQSKLEFPSRLSSFDRMLVHEIAEKFKLIHVSEGDAENRQIIVFKNKEVIKPHKYEGSSKDFMSVEEPAISSQSSSQNLIEINANETVEKSIKTCDEEMIKISAENGAELLNKISAENAAELLTKISAENAAELLNKISAENGAELLNKISAENAAELLLKISAENAAELLNKIPAENAAELLNKISAENGAELLNKISAENAAELLNKIPAENGAELLNKISAENGAELLNKISAENAAELLNKISAENAAELLNKISAENGAELLNKATVAKSIVSGIEGTFEKQQSQKSATFATTKPRAEPSKINLDKCCPKCSKIVPENNYTLHINHCQKLGKKVAKNKTQNILNDNKISEEMILENIAKSKDVCAFSKCKTSVKLLGQICNFCKEQFCLSHHMAEIHGCGNEAKAQARSNIRKEIASCHKESTKKLDAVKRIHVQRKLDKKLEEMASQRKGGKKK